MAYTLFSACRIENRGFEYLLEYGTLSFVWDINGDWYLTLHEAPQESGSSEYQGICGNYDNDPNSKCYT